MLTCTEGALAFQYTHLILVPFSGVRSYVLAGNPDLHETTVANSDELIPVPDTDKWHIEVYPNPLTSKRHGLNIAFKGVGYKETGSYQLDVYNLKGQKLQSQDISMDTLHDGYLTLVLDSFPKGVLLLSISKDSIQVNTKKLTNY